jgi:hypothetical protein
MLQRRIGLLFSGLAALSLVFNAFVDQSPESFFNSMEMVVVALTFLATTLREGKIFKTIQLVTITVCAVIAFRLSENPYFGFAMITVMGILLYAYGGYRTFKGFKIILSLCFVYLLSFFSILGFIPLSLEVFFKAFNWTAFIFVTSTVLWWVLIDIETQFHLKMRTGIENNKKELDDIKKAVGDKGDGSKTTGDS